LILRDEGIGNREQNFQNQRPSLLR
jgi:hypothetical protein